MSHALDPRGAVTRRAFLARGAAAVAAVALATPLLAQAEQLADSTAEPKSPATNMVMNQGAVRPVRLPPKPGVHGPSMTADARDELEHHIGCQCGCTLDVYTCRTTDFTCSVSPSMHRDVMALVEGGYSAPEILDAFVDVYGEKVLMAPRKEGFNWAAWIAPFAALGAGAVAVSVLVRRWGSRPAAAGAASGPTLHVDATPEELARLEAAVREDKA